MTWQLLKSLLEYSSINAEVSKAVSQKSSNHLWYLAPEIVGLALFDSQVSAQTKRLMVRAMKDGNEDHEQGATEYFPVNLCATAGASGLGVWGTRTTDYC